MSTIADKEDYSLYANAFGYMRKPFNFKPLSCDADVVVLGLPFDLAVTGRSGARMGPNAIRRASVNLAWEASRMPWNFKLQDKLNIVDCGDLVYSCGDPAEFTQSVTAFVDSLLGAKKMVLGLGGDHYVTLPILRAYHKHFGKMALVHFDAHTDTYSAGSKYDHGTMFYHAPKEGLIDPNHSIQLGIRTEYDFDNHEFEVLSASSLNDMSIDEISSAIRKRVNDLPVYLTFDIDCLDPAYAPGTGTPVCGGISSDKALKIIRSLKGINVVGFDVVEVAEAYDSSEITALAGATLALEMLYLYASDK